MFIMISVSTELENYCFREFGGILQTPPYVYAVAGGLFWSWLRLPCTAQLRKFSLLKPFLTFKSHITTVLIAQNVAKALINNL